MLYVGNIKNGAPGDDTGEAWYIVRDDEKDTPYMKFEGEFKGGHAVKEKGKFQNPYSYNEIIEFVNEEDYACPLVWYYYADVQ